MKIENWSLVSHNLNPYQAPEQVSLYIHGNVYGNGKFEDGAEITTSRVIKIENGVVNTRSGSQYKLGEIDPDYLKAYPTALDLLKGKIAGENEKTN